VGVVQLQVLFDNLFRKRRQTTTDNFTLAGLRADKSVSQSQQFDFPTQQPGKDSSIATVLTPHCCKLHTNMSYCDTASSLRYTYVTCDVVGLCQLLYVHAAYRLCVTCACTCHVQHCSVWQFERRRQKYRLLCEALLCNLLCVMSKSLLILKVVSFFVFPCV